MVASCGRLHVLEANEACCRLGYLVGLLIRAIGNGILYMQIQD